MEEAYDLGQYTHCLIIHLGKTDVYFKIFDLSKKKHPEEIDKSSKKACIAYNQQKTKVLSWGTSSVQSRNKESDDIHISNFLNGLYQVFKKGEDDFLITAVSDFLRLETKELMQFEMTRRKNQDSFSLFYSIIIPSEWEENIREDLIRPIFTQANLISKDDHKDRLLFVSDIESICYNQSHWFKRNQNTVLCRLTPIEPDKTLVKLDLINTANTLFDMPGSNLFPKVIRSNLSSITSDDIRSRIKAFLKESLFPNSQDANHNKTIETIEEALCNIQNTEDNLFNFYLSFFYNDEEVNDTFMKPILTDTTKWKLDDAQAAFLKSIRRFDLFSIIGDTIFSNIKDLLVNQQSVKKYTLIITEDHFSSNEELANYLSIWREYMLKYDVPIYNNLTTLPSAYQNDTRFYHDDTLNGAMELIKETVQNSNINSPPHIISENNQVTSSKFLYYKPDAIMNIDISLKSTMLSYSLLKDDGTIKEIFDHNYFIADKGLPSLEQFYGFPNLIAPKVKEQFIKFSEKYLLRDLDPLSDNEDFLSVNKGFLSEIKAILNKLYSKAETSGPTKKEPYISESEGYLDPIKKTISTYSSSYTNFPSTQLKNPVKAFLLLYLIYIKEIILSKLPKHPKFENMKIGYAFSIEKMLLHNIIVGKEDLREIIYTSDLINKEDKNKKLRIFTKGEGILSTIQQSFDLEFPMKSYFVLAQLYEDFIQLTLNQVVVISSVEDTLQEAIIVEDKIISIQNIYDSLCLNMWNSLMQNSSIVQLCNIHSKSKDDELFSLETKKEFMSNLKQYISNNILDSNAKLQNSSKTIVKMNHSCNCHIQLVTNDIIEVSFKPFLKDLTRIMLASLINESLFGRYRNIKYHFSLIHFNHNAQLQKILTTIIKEEARNYNPKRGIDTVCLVIPALPFQVSQSLLPFLYKAFKKGTLHQIYNKNYSISIENRVGDDCNPDPKYIFRLLKKEDKIDCIEINKTFYISFVSKFNMTLKIGIREYEMSDILKSGLISKQYTDWKDVANFDLDYISKDQYPNGKIPIIVTIKSLGYSSLIQLSTKLVGKDITNPNIHIVEIGNPMTLCRC